MAGDNLHEVLQVLRRELGLDEDVLQRMDEVIRREYGATRVYIAAHRKRRRLQQIESAAPDEEARRIADRLGITDRHARRLIRMVRD